MISTTHHPVSYRRLRVIALEFLIALTAFLMFCGWFVVVS